MKSWNQGDQGWVQEESNETGASVGQRIIRGVKTEDEKSRESSIQISSSNIIIIGYLLEEVGKKQ